MKRLTLVALTVCTLAFNASAQFKQAGNENNLQVTFAPFGSTPISLNDGNITYRRFFSGGTMAVRLGLSVGNTKSTDITFQANDTAMFADTLFDSDAFGNPYKLAMGFNPEGQTVSKTSWFSIRPGFEKHFTGTDRLSPYIGFEFYFTSSKTTTDRDTIMQGDYKTGIVYDTVAPPTITPVLVTPWTKSTIKEKTGSKTFGVNLIAGMDYYFTKNLSLGVEFGFGFYSTKYDDLESEHNVNTYTKPVTDVRPGDLFTTHYTNINYSNQIVSSNATTRGKSSGFGPNVITKIKLGWLF